MTTKCNPVNGSYYPPSPEQLNDEQEIALIAKALSHEARLRILSILTNLDREGGCLNSDFISQLDLAQSTISEHLRVLKKAGLITAEPMPPRVCYRINTAKLAQFQRQFTQQFL